MYNYIELLNTDELKEWKHHKAFDCFASAHVPAGKIELGVNGVGYYTVNEYSSAGCNSTFYSSGKEAINHYKQLYANSKAL